MKLVDRLVLVGVVVVVWCSVVRFSSRLVVNRFLWMGMMVNFLCGGEDCMKCCC